MHRITTSCLHPLALAIGLGLALVADPVSAQQMDHSKMNMPMPKPAAKAPVKQAAVKAPVKKTPVAPAPARKKPPVPATARSTDSTSMQGMDHSKMPMSDDEKSMEGMDHSRMSMPDEGKSMEGMDHSTIQGMDHSKMSMPDDDKSMEAMDHSTMQGMDHSKMPMSDGDKSMEGMDHSKMSMSDEDKPMEGMDYSTMQGMDHGGMTMAPTEAGEPIPELTAADRAAAVRPAGGHGVHDNSIQRFVLLDRLEGWNADQGTGLEWEAQAWIGTDLNRLWLRSEGERVDGTVESADVEVLYGRSVATWWDVVAGIRHDFKPGSSQDFAAFGVIGLVPYKFEVEATAYVGQGGQTAARLEAEYELLLTNRLILQPLVEINLYGKNDPRRGIGSGLSTVEAGLRLRYEFTRKLAPYFGVVRERAFGRTGDLRRLDGEDIDDTRIVAGLRLWF